MFNKTPRHENVKLEKIQSQLSRQQKELDKLHEDYSTLKNNSTLNAEWLMSTAKAEAISQGCDIEKRLSEKNKSSLTSIKIMIGILSATISIFGFLGMQVFIQHAVEKGFTEEIKKRVQLTEKKALKTLDEADKLYKDTYKKLGKFKNDLIVLQTDFGAESPYMGIIKGVIYHINPNARIDVITDEVPAFDIFEAAWILSKAVEHYPRDTIFVSITGEDVSSPVILRNKKKRHTFIGFLNGAFDIVKPPDGFDDVYSVNLKKLVREGENLKLWPKSEQSRNLGSIVYLGFIAGSLSKMPAPWERNSDNEHNMPWNKVLDYTTYKITDEFKNINPVVIPTESQNSILFEGTIMNIDRFGNANTNISEIYFENELAKKNIELDNTRRVRIGAGIASDFGGRNTVDTIQNKDKIKLKPIEFSKEYSTISEGKPLITVVNGKLQLAISNGNLSQSKALLVDAAKEQISDSSRFIKSRMKVRIKIEKETVPYHLISSSKDIDIIKSFNDTGKK